MFLARTLKYKRINPVFLAKRCALARRQKDKGSHKAISFHFCRWFLGIENKTVFEDHMGFIISCYASRYGYY